MEQEISLEAFMAGAPVEEAPKTVSIEEFRKGSKVPKDVPATKPILSRSGVELSKRVGTTYKAKTLTGPNAKQAAAVPIPDAMQKEYDQYVGEQERGSINPEEYAAFRLDQNKRFGFGSSPEDRDTYIAEATKLNDLTKDANLRIPGAGVKDLTLDEQRANRQAQSPVGAGIIAAGDVASGNFLDELSGISEDGIDENAANNPISSLVGTLEGALTLPVSRGASVGTQALEGLAAGSILGAGEAEDDERGEGALLGGALGLGGNVLAGKVFKTLPEGTVADEAVDALGKAPNTPKPPLTAAEKLTKAIKQAGPIREEQTAAFTAARTEKFGKLAKAQEGKGGREAYINSLKAMKGELPKSDFEVVKKALTVDDVTELFDNISTAPISPGSRLSAHSGLEKLLEGKLPQPKELENLSDIFSPEFVQSVLSKRGDISKAGGVFSEAWNVTKSLQSTADISGLLRQGVGLIHRPEWWKSLGPMVKATFNTKQAAKFESEIKSDPLYDLANEADLSLTTTGKLGVNEDMFRSHLAEKIPVWGSVVRGSERSFVTFLNKLRFDTFKSLMNEAKDLGTDIADPEVAKGVARYINVMTGRGGLGSLKSSTEALNNVFYSPGMISSRLQILAAPVQAAAGKGFIAELPKGLRKEAAKSYASIIGLNTTALGLATMAGNSVGLNPLSSEFLKFKDGDTRLDFGAGLTQYIVAGARALTRQSTSGGEEGNTRELKRSGDTPLDNDLRFVMNKMHPSLTLFLDQQRGKNTIGEPFEWQKALIARLTPMGFPDIAATLKEHGGDVGVFYGVLGLLGAGLSNYKDTGSREAAAMEEFFKGTPVEEPEALQEGEISLEDFYKGQEVE